MSMSELSRIERRCAWGVAICIVGLVHVAAIAAKLRVDIERNTDDPAAFVVELAPMATASIAPVTTAPVGPLRPDAAAAAAVARSANDTKSVDAIDLPPLPTLNDLASVLSAIKAPTDVKPEPVRNETPTAEPAMPSASTQPSVAAAPPPTLTARPMSTASAAPVRGQSQDDRRAVQRWQAALAAHLVLFRQRPPEVARTDLVALVAFTIDRAGRVVSVEVARSSGRASHDATALAIVRRASPVPRPPADVPAPDLSFVIPIRFERLR
jgi:periplasmic protein TonB